MYIGIYKNTKIYKFTWKIHRNYITMTACLQIKSNTGYSISKISSLKKIKSKSFSNTAACWPNYANVHD